MLGHRLAGTLKVLDRAVDRGRVLALSYLDHLIDRRAKGRPIPLGQFVLVLVEQLLELIDALIGGVAGLGQVALSLILGRMSLGLPLHLLDLLLAQAARRLDL